MTDEQIATRTPTPAEHWDSSPAVAPGGGASTALIVVDMQNDFGHPDGSLFVAGGDAIVGAINDEIERTAAGGGTIVLTQDWHPPSTPHFIDDGGVWPTHCVAGTWGAELLEDLDPNRRASAVIRKGTNGEDGYSAFAMREPGGDVDIPTGLSGLLRERGVERAVIVGLATDVCVAATAVSAAAAGFDTTVLWEATRPVHPDAGTAASVLSDLRSADVDVNRRAVVKQTRTLELGPEIVQRWVATRGPLLADMYQLAMAQVYVAEGVSERHAQFDYSYRSNPNYGTHQAGFCVSAGLGPFLDWLDSVEITSEHTDALAALTSDAGSPSFSDEFLDWLSAPDRFDGIEIRAVAEGRVVHPYEPVISVTGPLAVCQLIETSLLNHMNYPTLIATKAARVVRSARGGRVLEFGMRRGPSTGVNEGIRAALIGGCASTSNVEAAIALGRQPIGTHAHSLVQAFIAIGEGELGAFRALATTTPDDCILLVDTVDTLESGVPNAITVFDELRSNGHEPVGVRLDSGDLAYLAVQTAKLLDEAGYPDVSIVLSSDLDELNIWQILTQIGDDAERVGIDPGPIRARLVYGVGTRLITSHGSSALNGVYKLVGIENGDGEWTPAIKISEDPGKVPLPGRKTVWRLYDQRGAAVVDLIGLADEDPFPTDTITVHHPNRNGLSQMIRRQDISHVEELQALVRPGSTESIDDLAQRCADDIDRLDVGVRRLVNPHRYHVSITDELSKLLRDLVAQAHT